MPAMLRIPGKATKIAYNLLGKPASLKYKRTHKQEVINKQLIMQETTRAR